MHVLIIFLLIVGLVIARMHSPRLEEGFIAHLGYLYGPYIGADIPVTNVKKLNDGSSVYIAKQGIYVKMVTDKGEAKYFEGDISSFNPNSWNSYTNVGNNYMYKPPPPTITKLSGPTESVTQTPMISITQTPPIITQLAGSTGSPMITQSAGSTGPPMQPMITPTVPPMQEKVVPYVQAPLYGGIW